MYLRNIIVVIILAVILLLAIAGETYFYVYSEKQNSSADTVIQNLQNAIKTKRPSDLLADAKSNLEIQKEKLAELEADFPTSPFISADIKADVSAAAAADAKANALAAKVKLDPIAEASIIALGQKAATALLYFQSLVNAHASTVVLNDAALNATELVAAYTRELAAYVDTLKPSPSGSTGSQIAGYQEEAGAIVAEVKTTEDSLVQIDSIPAGTAPGSAVTTPSTSSSGTQAPGSGTQAPDNGQTPSDNSQTGGVGTTAGPSNSSGQNQTPDQGQGTGQPGNSGSGGVTLGDITNQETVVTQTTDEINQLADQVAADATSTSGSSGSSAPSDNGNNGGDNGGYSGGSNPIQPQNGAVKLIEGENTF